MLQKEAKKLEKTNFQDICKQFKMAKNQTDIDINLHISISDITLKDGISVKIDLDYYTLIDN